MYRVLLYFELEAERVKSFVDSLGDQAQNLEKPSRRYHIDLSSSDEIKTIELWEIGKVICSSSLSYDKAIEGGRWLRQALKSADSKSVEVIAYGKIHNGKAELLFSKLDLYRCVCEIELREVFLVAENLKIKLTGAVAARVTAALADWEVTELVRVTRYDGELVVLKSMTIDLEKKDALLLALSHLLEKAEREKEKGTTKVREVARIILTGAGVAIGNVALNVLASAIWEHVVRVWVNSFVHLHLDGDEPMLSAPLKELATRFPEIPYLAKHGQATITDMVSALNLPSWRVQADLNWLTRRKIVEERAIEAFTYFRLIVAKEYPKFAVTTPVPGEALEIRLNNFPSVLDV